MKQLAILLLITGLALPALAQDKKAEQKPKQATKAPEAKKEVPRNKLAFLTPKKAGPDFEVQGEYVGKVHNGELQIGMQVVAMGDGKFAGVVFPGGLPGAGWDGKTRIKLSGQTEGDMSVIKSEMGHADIKDGVAVAYNKEEFKIGELRKVVRRSPTLGMKPPVGAMVLFDGKSADKFKNGKVVDGMLQQGMTSKDEFGSFKLHMEFMLSYMPYARGQGRSNSGVYMQGRYECQILDSFGLTGEHNECGGIYEIAKPKVNMCLPPLSWQTYDVEFRAAEFDAAGKKAKSARLTVRHNGVLIHDNVEADRSTRASPRKEGPEKGPIYIQNHGNPVRFKNIWVAPLK